MVAANANIPIPRQEAKLFKQHFQNDMLRPEITGNFQSLELFRIAQAYVIDDATNKKYDLFASKLVDLGDGIIYDSVTKLLWTKNATPYGRGIYFEKYDDHALEFCNRFKIKSLAGWRLAKKRELARMYSVSRGNEPNLFTNLETIYKFGKDPHHDCVNINTKEVGCIFKTTFMWCVRGIQ